MIEVHFVIIILCGLYEGQLCVWVLSRSVMSDSLKPYGPQSTRLLCPWSASGMNTGVGCHALRQGIFPTQGLNLCLLHLRHWKVSSLPLVPRGKPMKDS